MRRFLWLLLIFMISTAIAEEQINPEEIGFGVENAKDLGITNPKIVSSLDIDFLESGVFDIVPQGSKLDKLKLQVRSYPRSDYYLSMSQISTSPSSMSGEDYYDFEWLDVPSGKLDYSLSSRIKTRFDVKKISSSIPFPFSTVPDEYKIFLQPSQKINSDDPNIKKLANKLVLGETDAYLAAYKLADFVSNNMVYDLTYLGRIEPASRVVQDKKGVCVEYSNLFISLARSVGIPARYISGYAYGNVYGEKFNAHAWAEIWLPDVGWIPVDTTFGEFGWVDMTHIKTQLSGGPEEPSLTYSWTGGDVSTTEPSVRVDLHAKEEILPDLVSNDMWVEKSEVGLDSYNVIWMSMDNKENYYLAPEAFLTAAPQIMGPNQRSVALMPKGSGVVGWIVKTPDDLDPNFIYTYTINGESLFGGQETAEFVVNPKSEDIISLDDAEALVGAENLKPATSSFSPNLNIDLSYPRVGYSDETFEISVNLYNSGNAPFDNLVVCVENDGKKCDNVFLGINDHQTLVFDELITSAGQEKFYVTVEGENIQENQELTIQIDERGIFEKILRSFLSLFK